MNKPSKQATYDRSHTQNTSLAKSGRDKGKQNTQEQVGGKYFGGSGVEVGIGGSDSEKLGEGEG